MINIKLFIQVRAFIQAICLTVEIKLIEILLNITSFEKILKIFLAEAEDEEIFLWWPENVGENEEIQH